MHRVAVEGFWIDERPVTVGQFRRFVKDTGYVTLAERPLDPALYPGADPELLVPGRAGVPAHARTGRPVRRPQLVVLHAGRLLVAPRGPRERHLHARAPPGHAGRLRGRRGLRGVGGQGAPDRGGVGVRGARRPRGQGVRVGRRARAGRGDAGELLAGRVPVAEPAARRLRRHLAGRRLPGQRLRPLRHDRQRVGVDGRPLHRDPRARSRRAAGRRRRTRRSRAASSRAARTCARRTTACASGPPRARARRSTRPPATSASAASSGTAEPWPTRSGRCCRWASASR